MIIIDNVIDLDYQERLKSLLLGKDFPWFYLEDVTNEKNKLTQKRPALVHTFIRDGEQNSSYVNELLPLIETACRKANIGIEGIYRIKTFLQMPLVNEIIGEDILDTVHIDTTLDHWVMIYYPIDCDGHTVILNKEYTDELGMYPVFENVSERIVKKVEPKQGRVLFFRGNIYHTAEQPKKGIRCIINFNLV